MTRACHWYNLLPVNHQRISGCKRQAVVQMRCCTEDLPSGHAEQGFPSWLMPWINLLSKLGRHRASAMHQHWDKTEENNVWTI